jgi:hypothetical protein
MTVGPEAYLVVDTKSEHMFDSILRLRQVWATAPIGNSSGGTAFLRPTDRFDQHCAVVQSTEPEGLNTPRVDRGVRPRASPTWVSLGT